MQIGDDIFFDLQELEEAGINPETARVGAAKGYAHWKSVKSPLDSRKTLLSFDKMSPKYKEMVLSKFGNPDKWQKIDPEKLKTDLKIAQIEAKKQQKDLKKVVNEAYNNDWWTFAKLYKERYGEKKGRFGLIYVQLAKAASVFSVAVSSYALGNVLEYVDTFGIRQPKTFKNLYLMFIEELDLPYLKLNERSFYEKIKAALQSDVFSVIDLPRSGNQNARVLDSFYQYLVETYASNPKNPTVPMIKTKLDYVCQLYGFDSVSESSIQQHLSKREVKTRIDASRYGKKYFNDLYKPFTKRAKALFAGDLWVIDGTKKQIPYWDEKKNKRAYLNVFAVRDEYSGLVLGWAAGSENTIVVMKSLEMATVSMGNLTSNEHGALPAEILMDNSSAIKSDEIQSLLKNLAGVVKENFKAREKQFNHEFARNARVGNAQDKTIERYFKTQQTRIDKWFDHYIGGSPLSKEKNNSPSPEYLALMKRDNLPNYDGLLQLIAASYTAYNHEVINDCSPMERFKASECENITPLTAFQKAELFWLKRKVTVKNNWITVTVNHVEYDYAITEFEAWQKITRERVNVYFHPQAMESIIVYDKDGNPICTCKLVTEADKPNRANVHNGEQQRLQIIKNESKSKSFERKILNEIEQLRQEAEETFAQKTEGLTFDDLDMKMDYAAVGKNKRNDAESAAMEEYFLQAHDHEPSLAVVPVLEAEKLSPFSNKELLNKKKKKTGLYEDVEGDFKPIED